MTRDEIYRIAAAASVDWRTAKNVLAGGKCNPATRTVVLAAAKGLGIRVSAAPKGKATRARAA